MKEFPTFQFDVFLCHNSRDKPAVREIERLLKERRLSCWLDEVDTQPGLSSVKGLEQGIVTSRCVAVFVGPHGLGPWQKKEVEAALQLAVDDGRPVIPVLLPGWDGQPPLPLFLKGKTWVDLRPEITEEKLERLIHGITGQRPPEPAPSPKSAVMPGPSSPVSSFSGIAKLEFCRHLGEDWRDLADTLEIPAHKTRAWPQGDEARMCPEARRRREERFMLKTHLIDRQKQCSEFCKAIEEGKQVFIVAGKKEHRPYALAHKLSNSLSCDSHESFLLPQVFTQRLSKPRENLLKQLAERLSISKDFIKQAVWQAQWSELLDKVRDELKEYRCSRVFYVLINCKRKSRNESVPEPKDVLACLHFWEKEIVPNDRGVPHYLLFIIEEQPCAPVRLGLPRLSWPWRCPPGSFREYLKRLANHHEDLRGRTLPESDPLTQVDVIDWINDFLDDNDISPWNKDELKEQVARIDYNLSHHDLSKCLVEMIMKFHPDPEHP